MPPVCKKTRGFSSVKKKKRRLGDGLRKWNQRKRAITPKDEIITRRHIDISRLKNHNDHSYYKSNAKSTLENGESGTRNETSKNEESFNPLEIASAHKDGIVTRRQNDIRRKRNQNNHSCNKNNEKATMEKGQSITHTEICENEESFNSIEIACSNTPCSASGGQRLDMEGVICDQSNCNENWEEESLHLEDMSACSLTDVCSDGVPETYCVRSRRIVNFASVFSQIKEIDNHNKVLGCSIQNCYVKHEKCYGLRSVYELKCDMCNLEFKINTDDEDNNENTMDVNTASVAGAMAIGIGYSQLQELLTSMELPSMSAATFCSYHDKLAEGWDEAAPHEMEASASKGIENPLP